MRNLTANGDNEESRGGGLLPPLTPPYVSFMAYGGFQSAFAELAK